MGAPLGYALQTATYSPKIKRAAHLLSDGRGVAVVFDTQLAALSGSGAPKIQIYRSTDSTRSVWVLDQEVTPATSFATSTRAAVASSAVADDDTLCIVYAGTDESLRFIQLTNSGGAFAAPTHQTVATGSATANKFRALDIDVTNMTTGINVAAYIASASSGVGASYQIHRRRNNGTTWVQIINSSIISGQTILAGSEDISVAGNVTSTSTGQPHGVAVYVTRTTTSGDSGDLVRELTDTTDQSVTNQATTVVTWYSALRSGIAAGKRRGFLFREDTDSWCFGIVTGTSLPTFMVARLEHNVSTGIVENATNVDSSSLVSSGFQMVTSSASQAYVSASFIRGRFIFGFLGIGVTSRRIARSVVIRMDEDFTEKTAVAIDSVARVLDNGATYSNGGPVYIAGGSSANVSGSVTGYNFLIGYGPLGVNLASQEERICTDDAPQPPILVSPSGNPATWRPTFKAIAKALTLYSGYKAVLQVQYGLNSSFLGAVTMTQSAVSDYLSYSSENGGTQPSRVLSAQIPVGAELGSSTYYVRTRMLTDFGRASTWSSTKSFTISHPPAAIPIYPRSGGYANWGTGAIEFSWDFSDTEPEDHQSAYRIKIQTSAGATIVDTGKVTLDNNYATLTIPPAYKDTTLQYIIALWDTANTGGLYSEPVQFIPSDATSVVISDPTGTVASTSPTVAWTYTSPDDVVQAAYRVILRDEDGESVADSKWISSASTTHVFPNANLSNGDYTVEVYFVDSSGYETSANADIVPNGSFVRGVMQWTLFRLGSFAYDRLRGYGQLGAMRTIPSGVGVSPAMATGLIPALEDHSYTGSVWALTKESTDLQLAILRYNSVGTFISSAIVSVTPSVNKWTKLTVTGVTPADTAFVALYLGYAGTPPVTSIVWWDDAMLYHTPYPFTVSVTPPAAPTTNAVQIPGAPGVRVTWTNASKDIAFDSWRVYRKYQVPVSADIDEYDTANTWELIYETPDDESSYTFDDYFTPLNKPCSYVVVQSVDMSEGFVESSYAGAVTLTISSPNFFVIPEVSIGSIASYSMGQISGDSFVNEIERNEVFIPGRGRQMQVGEPMGVRGTLTIKAEGTNGREDREFYQYLERSGAVVWLKNPFGDVIRVCFYDVSVDRVPGRGTTDAVGLSVGYAEVLA